MPLVAASSYQHPIVNMLCFVGQAAASHSQMAQGVRSGSSTLCVPNSLPQVPALDEEFGADAAGHLAQLVGGGKRFTATVVRRERGGGAKEKHPRKAADKLHVTLKSEDGSVDVSKEMLLAGMARLPKIHKVCI